MAAPKGNKYAKGNPTSGRPPKYDLEKESQDLLKWSLRQDALRLYGFTDNKDYCVTDLPYFSKRSEVFSNALKKTKERLALRREQYCNEDMICKSVYEKTNHLYDHELRDSDDNIKDKDLERKIKLIDYELKRKAEMEINRGLPPNDNSLDNLIAEIKTLKDKVNATNG